MHYDNGKWEFFAGISLNTWALPLQVSIGVEDIGRRWGIGVRVLCFTFGMTKDFQGYMLVRGTRLHVE
jgi:hypothetical protein